MMRSGFLGLVLMAVAAAWAGPAAAQEGRLAALVVAVGDGGARADAVQGALEAMGAETLRADDPNNAELRSLLMRFAGVAETKAAAVVYLDAPVAELGAREFVLPAGVRLARPTDVLTGALPLSAFARAAAVAGEGGAVFVVAATPDPASVAGLDPARRAPAPRIGAAPVIFAPEGSSRALVQALSGLGGEEEVELGALVARITASGAATVSRAPSGALWLARSETAETVVEEEEPAFMRPAALEAASGPLAPAADAGAQDVEVLAALEQALSRSAKRRIQRALRDDGYYRGLIDGIIGQQTRAAIRAYQRAAGLPETGYLTQEQIGRLQ